MNEYKISLSGAAAQGAPRPKNKFWLKFLGLLFLLLLVGGGFMALKVGNTFWVISERIASFLGTRTQDFPQADPAEQNRIDILVLGLRGEGEEHGGSLTDTLLLVSIKTDEKKVALISIPRDTYLKLPVVNRKTKINEAFELGERAEPGGGGLFLAKRAVQEIVGVNIDYVVSVDFRAFQEIVDQVLSGIDVEVAKPFRENLQWGGIDFYVPQGIVHMDGNTALYYVRSRFTTSDFDRARRQQEVLLAMRKKASALGLAAHPEKVISILTTLGRHIRADANANDILKLVTLGREYASIAPERLVIDTSTGLLASASIDGAYVLLPTTGSFIPIHDRVRNIFEETR